MQERSSFGAYTPESMAELVADVIDRPITVPHLTTLKNKYYGLRHGESEANVAGIISSDPAIGTTTHQLTANGAVQARRAATALIETLGRENLTPERCIFVTSDFMRAWQTSFEVITFLCWLFEHEESPVKRKGWVVNTPPSRPTVHDFEVGERLEAGKIMNLQISKCLRERYFGIMDGKPLIWYNKVWPVRIFPPAPL